MVAGQVGTVGSQAPSGVPLERPMLEMEGFAGWWKRRRWAVVSITEVILVVIAWDILIARFEVLNPIFFPAPSGIAVELQKMIVSGELWKHLSFSLRNLFVGYVSAAAVGISLGLVIGASRVLDRLWTPIIWSLYSTPMIAIRPLLILWFGFAWQSLAFLVFLMAFWPILINTMAGVQTVERTLMQAGKVFGASRLQLYTKIILPFTVPFVVTGLRLAVGTALIGMLVGELVSSNLGLGYIVAMGSIEFNMSKGFAAIVILIGISLTGVNFMRWLEHRVAPWRRGSAGG